MFFLKSNDNFLLNSIVNVLNQKSSIFNINNATNSFATLSISSNESTLFIETGNYKKSIFKPLSFTKLFEEIDSILTKIDSFLAHQLEYSQYLSSHRMLKTDFCL